MSKSHTYPAPVDVEGTEVTVGAEVVIVAGPGRHGRRGTVIHVEGPDMEYRDESVGVDWHPSAGLDASSAAINPRMVRIIPSDGVISARDCGCQRERLNLPCRKS